MNRPGKGGGIRMHAGVAVLVGTLLGGCASVGDAAGWRGESAEPFDGAKAACESETAATPKAERTADFEACMAKRGWHRP